MVVYFFIQEGCFGANFTWGLHRVLTFQLVGFTSRYMGYYFRVRLSYLIVVLWRGGIVWTVLFRCSLAIVFVGGVVTYLLTTFTIVVFPLRYFTRPRITRGGSAVRSCTGSSVLVYTSANSVVCRGGTCRRLSPTSIAGVVDVLLILRTVSDNGVSLRSRIPTNRGDIGVNKSRV